MIGWNIGPLADYVNTDFRKFRKEPLSYPGNFAPAKWIANTASCSSKPGLGGYGFLKEATPPNSMDENHIETFLMVRKWRK
jgi:hypothetical protein